jgi:hypothetical protein
MVANVVVIVFNILVYRELRQAFHLLVEGLNAVKKEELK